MFFDFEAEEHLGSKVLFVIGAGTQSRCLESPDFRNEASIASIFTVDSKLDKLCSSSNKYALISLNVTWHFPSTFHFHGVVPEGTLVARTDTRNKILQAQAYLHQKWGGSAIYSEDGSESERQRVHVVYIGVGLTTRNGSGLLSLLQSLSICKVTVVDIAPTLAEPRNRWLQSTFRPPSPSTAITYISSTAEDFLLRDSDLECGAVPTSIQLRAAYSGILTWQSMSQADPVILQLVQNILDCNEYKPDIPVLTRGQLRLLLS
jgi:hypothetical protein